MIQMNQFLNCDCEEFMATVPDKFFELAIVDPPYGINIIKIWGSEKFGYKQYEKKEWDNSIPDKKYFDELNRISINQIIWGGNYFTEFLKASQCWIIWDKGQREFTLADGEMAWASFKNSMRIFDYSRAKAFQTSKNEKIHPTQKPVALYRWLLLNYAKKGDKIFDSHVGSASSLIACHLEGFEFVGCELDPDYYREAKKRLEEYQKQQSLF